MKPLSLKQRMMLAWVIAVLSCAVQLLYYKYISGRRWTQVPAHKWEQIAAQIKHGTSQPAPLDSVTIMADLQDWLRLRHP